MKYKTHYCIPDENLDHNAASLNAVEQKRAVAKRFIVDPDLKILVSVLPVRRRFAKEIIE